MSETDKYGRVKTDMGGDELHRLVKWDYPKGQEPPITPESVKEAFDPQFWTTVDAVAKECNAELEKYGLPKVGESVFWNDEGEWQYQESESKYSDMVKRNLPKFSRGEEYSERNSTPYSPQWYAAKIGGLCWLINQDRAANDEFQLSRVFEIGWLTQDRWWRQKYKPNILSAKKRQKLQLENGLKGARRTQLKAEEAKMLLRQIAFDREKLVAWIGQSPAGRIRSIREFARRHDSEATRRGETVMFSRSNGELYSKKWFSDLLDEWQGSGEITQAVETLAAGTKPMLPT